MPKYKKAAAYVKPPPCGASYRFTTATYSTASSSNPGSPPDPALNSAPTTPPSQDKASRVVLICASTLTPCPARYELGTTPYDGTVPATGEILASANAELQTTAGWVVNFTIKSQYSAFFDTVAKKNYHLPLAIDLGGQVESAPTINAMSFGGSGEISGDFTQPQAQALALVLKYGQIPIALTQATYTTVSPTLGKKSLQAGVLAGLLGLLLVMFYTIFYYRALGVVVVLGLVSTGALIYAIISLLGATSAGLTLDLSGMTGLIVSVGITVDSYVVYFERLKDEVRAGRSIRSSVDRGFKSAYRTILSARQRCPSSAHWCSGCSPSARFRGFAFMLGLSTIVDVITAYTFTRPLVILLGRNRVFTDARGFGVASGLAEPRRSGHEHRLDRAGRCRGSAGPWRSCGCTTDRPVSTSSAGGDGGSRPPRLVIIAGLASLGVKGLNYSIEFVGGTSWQVAAPGVTVAQAQKALTPLGFGGATITVLGSGSKESLNVEAKLANDEPGVSTQRPPRWPGSSPR